MIGGNIFLMKSQEIFYVKKNGFQGLIG